MRSDPQVRNYVLRPGLALEYLGDDIAMLDEAGGEASRVSGEAAEAVRTLLGRRCASPAEMGTSNAVIAELLAKGFVDVAHTPTRRGVIAAGAAGVTALALPSRVAAESVGGSGGLAPQIPGAPTNLSVTNGDSAVQISFTPGSNGGAAITNYEYSTDGGVTWVALSPADATSPVVITTTSDTGAPLVNGTTYSIMLRARNGDNETGDQSSAVSATPAASTVATGGSVSTISVDGVAYRVHSFTSNGSFVLSEASDLEYLIVGGGGAGGGSSVVANAGGGGGGGGGFRSGTFVSLASATYPVVVGSGGTTNDQGVNGNSGNPSSLNSIESSGGGGGGAYNNNGVSGGSGGGGGSNSKIGGSGNSPSTSPAQGTNGGNGASTAGGGGGGAGGVGGNASGNTRGVRGNGQTSSITGTSVTYARGGDGGYDGDSGRVAFGIGGGGGGGGVSEGERTSASQGNAGTVVVRYRIPQIWD